MTPLQKQNQQDLERAQNFIDKHPTEEMQAYIYHINAEIILKKILTEITSKKNKVYF